MLRTTIGHAANRPDYARTGRDRTMKKRLLLVLDFDGFLVNSYALIRETMATFGLDVGDEQRFRNRRKFLKYFGGGRELLRNVVRFTLPKTRRLRHALTECYRERGVVYPEFVPLLNALIAHPAVHCGILSRNFTLEPGPTMRRVLARSGVHEPDLDFVVPIPVGAHKTDVLSAMRASRYFTAILGADEIGDYRAASALGYECLIGSYGFDARERLVDHGDVPPACIHDSPAALAAALAEALSPCLDPVDRSDRPLRYLGSAHTMGARYDSKSAVHAAHE